MLRRLHGGTVLGPERLAAWAAAVGVRYAPVPEREPGRFLASLEPADLLLVDVFPRGLVGELAPLLGRSPAWLISRRVRPDYYLAPPVRRVLETRYERILWTEAPPEALVGLEVPRDRVGPVLLGDPPLARSAARELLGVSPDAPLLLALGSGEVARQRRLLSLLQKLARRLGLHLRFVSDRLAPAGPVVRLFPAARILGAADVVVSAAGYHAFHECAASGVPTVFLPQRRLYDDQWGRAAGHPVARSPEELERAVDRLLREPPRPALPASDGAAEVADLVERRVQAAVLREEEVATMA